MPPSITANLLFAHGDTWGGGGQFVDDRTLFISPGMYPDFDKKQSHRFDKYQITFEGKPADGGWNSGKGWKLAETQIDPRYGDRYPIPRLWTKNREKLTLVKYLNYDSFLKSKGGQMIGGYDLHSYEIRNNKVNATCSLDDGSKRCLWADFDNFNRLIAARGSEVFIYQSFKEIIQKRPSKIIDLENFINRSKQQ